MATLTFLSGGVTYVHRSMPRVWTITVKRHRLQSLLHNTIGAWRGSHPGTCVPPLLQQGVALEVAILRRPASSGLASLHAVSHQWRRLVVPRHHPPRVVGDSQRSAVNVLVRNLHLLPASLVAVVAVDVGWGRWCPLPIPVANVQHGAHVLPQVVDLVIGGRAVNAHPILIIDEPVGVVGLAEVRVGGEDGGGMRHGHRRLAASPFCLIAGLRIGHGSAVSIHSAGTVVFCCSRGGWVCGEGAVSSAGNTVDRCRGGGCHGSSCGWSGTGVHGDARHEVVVDQHHLHRRQLLEVIRFSCYCSSVKNRKSKHSDDSQWIAKLEKTCKLSPWNMHQWHKAYCMWPFSGCNNRTMFVTLDQIWI